MQIKLLYKISKLKSLHKVLMAYQMRDLIKPLEETEEVLLFSVEINLSHEIHSKCKTNQIFLIVTINFT